jgi:hypothetical protein
MDNQQQQQMHIEDRRSVGELLLLGVGFTAIGLIALKLSHWAVPELYGQSDVYYASRPPL